MMKTTWLAIPLVVLACADQGPEGSMVELPNEIGPAADVIEVRATIPDARVPIDRPFRVNVHLRNPSSETVVITSACATLMYLYATRGEEELPLGAMCLTEVSEHVFEPGEERTLEMQARAHWEEDYAPGEYVLHVGTWAYEGIPEIAAPFVIR